MHLLSSPQLSLLLLKTSLSRVEEKTEHTMSYLLRNNHRTSKLGGGGTAEAPSRLLPRAAGGSFRRSAGGGQLQVHRPALGLQQKQTAQQQQQQQQRVQGVISMEEGTKSALVACEKNLAHDTVTQI